MSLKIIIYLKNFANIIKIDTALIYIFNQLYHISKLNFRYLKECFD